MLERTEADSDRWPIEHSGWPRRMTEGSPRRPFFPLCHAASISCHCPGESAPTDDGHSPQKRDPHIQIIEGRHMVLPRAFPDCAPRLTRHEVRDLKHRPCNARTLPAALADKPVRQMVPIRRSLATSRRSRRRAANRLKNRPKSDDRAAFQRPGSLAKRENRRTSTTNCSRHRAAITSSPQVRSNPATSEIRQLVSCLDLPKGSWQVPPDVASPPQSSAKGASTPSHR